MARADDIAVEWDGHARRPWEACLAQAGRSALQQGWAYGEALAAGGTAVHRLIARDGRGRPLALAQLAERRLLRCRRVLFLLRGPAWIEPAARERAEPGLLRAIGARFGRPILVWTPELPGPVAELHGRRPFVTPYATGWIDLAPDEAGLRAGLRGKWRNQLRRAERADLRVAEVGGGATLAWLLRENEAHRRRVGYQGLRPPFLAALAAAADAGRDLLALVAWDDGPTPAAGVLLVRHGAAATYEVGFASARGRELSATHLLLWHALVESKRRGVRWLDLGGLNTDKAPGIARFKLGLGAEVVTLAGTFVLRPERYS